MSDVDYKKLIRQQQNVINNLLRENAELKAQNKQFAEYILKAADSVTDALATVKQHAKALQAAELRAMMWKSLCEKVMALKKSAPVADVHIVESSEFAADLRGD